MVDTDGLIWTIAGTGASARVGDRGPAIKASLLGPRGIAFDAFGNLIAAEVESSSLRMIAFGKSPLCPPGYACPCALTPVPCTSPARVCPVGTVVPQNVTRGFVSVSVPVPTSLTSPGPGLGYAAVVSRVGRGSSVGSTPPRGSVRVQEPCPRGSYCVGGVAILCPAGTCECRAARTSAPGAGLELSPAASLPSCRRRGRSAVCRFVLQVSRAACAGIKRSRPLCCALLARLCPVGFYGPLEGATASNLTCTRCPPGTSTFAAGAAFCDYCAPGTYAAVGAIVSSNASACQPCAPGTYSRFGATACSKLSSAANSYLSAKSTSSFYDARRQLLLVQEPFTTSELSTAAALATSRNELIAAVTVALACAAPYFFLLLVRIATVLRDKLLCRCAKALHSPRKAFHCSCVTAVDRFLSRMLRRVDATASKDIDLIRADLKTGADPGCGTARVLEIESALNWPPSRSPGPAAHGPWWRRYARRSGARARALCHSRRSGAREKSCVAVEQHTKHTKDPAFRCLYRQYVTANSLSVRSVLPLLASDSLEVSAWSPNQLEVPAPLSGVSQGIIVQVTAMGPACAAPLPGSFFVTVRWGRYGDCCALELSPVVLIARPCPSPCFAAGSERRHVYAHDSPPGLVTLRPRVFLRELRPLVTLVDQSRAQRPLSDDHRRRRLRRRRGKLVPRLSRLERIDAAPQRLCCRKQ